MDTILKLVPYGENLAGELIEAEQVQHLLERLEASLAGEGLQWHDVSMVILANSKAVSSHRLQEESDLNIKDGLEAFCEDRKWHPSLIGTTVFSGFFRSRSHSREEISDGLLLVAVCSAVFDRIPVAREIERQSDLYQRKYAGSSVLTRSIAAFQEKMVQLTGSTTTSRAVADSSTGLLFTSGSGHVEASQNVVDFKECYAVGQELLKEASKFDAQIVGGCSTNRTELQSQCLYFSEQMGARTRYKYSYSHGAVMAFLPYTRAQLHLNHPYKRVRDFPKLDLKFHKKDQYEDGRNFYVSSINGREPIDFLEDYWDFTRDELMEMVEKRTAIPAAPKAHLVTVASSLNKRDMHIWPNVPIWLERVDDQIMMRLVRAEDEESNYYLMELEVGYLRENAKDLIEAVRSNFGEDVSMVTFLCESRKYVLNDHKSNFEAQELLGAATSLSSITGIYLNGEYSTGSAKSIGYHNYSQIGAILPHRPTRELPAHVLEAKRTAGVQVFACHSSRDKSTIRELIAGVQGHLYGVTHWIDEKELTVGESLTERIRSSIGREGQVFVALISDRSVDSSWVQQELRWAIEQEAIQGRPFVFPVVLDLDGDEVMTKVKASWGTDLVDYLDDRLQLVIRDLDERELEAKARILADAIAKRLDGEGPHHSFGWIPPPTP